MIAEYDFRYGWIWLSCCVHVTSGYLLNRKEEKWGGQN